MRVAVLGAGFQGLCVALEVAMRGAAVDLYDRNETCISQAGFWNEGKIHLGFTYANDKSLRTARLMADGALAFDRAMERWLGTGIDSIGLSPPFDYVVHRDSLLGGDEVLAHFSAVVDHVRTAGRGRTYLGEDARAVSFRILADGGHAYDPAFASLVLSTNERSIDTHALAEALARRVAGEPRITFLPRSEVRAVKRNSHALHVHIERDGIADTEPYDHVINCLWDGRLVIDRSFGVVDPRPWLFRLKHGVRLRLSGGTAAIPTATIVLGRFGDIVRIDDTRIYLSWYPACLAGLSHEVAPPAWPRRLTGDAARRTVAGTLAGLGPLVPSLRGLTEEVMDGAVVAGGIIAAVGESDIDDPDSHLHTRFDVGIHSVDDYHTIDTGKYTLAPMYALQVADRICGTG